MLGGLSPSKTIYCIEYEIHLIVICICLSKIVAQDANSNYTHFKKRFTLVFVSVVRKKFEKIVYKATLQSPSLYSKMHANKKKFKIKLSNEIAFSYY